MKLIVRIGDSSFKIDAESAAGDVIVVPSIRHERGGGVLRIYIGAMIERDKEGFTAMNKASDERHQVRVDTLRVEGVTLDVTGEPSARIRYTFEEFGGGRRYAYGETTPLGKRLEHEWREASSGDYAPILAYSKGCMVTW